MGPMRVNAFIKRKNVALKINAFKLHMTHGMNPCVKRKRTGEGINGFEPVKCQIWT